MTTRRQAMAAIAAASFDVLSAARSVHAQPAPRPARVAWISADQAAGSNYASFIDGLRSLGYVEGRNLKLDARWGGGSPERVEVLARELIRTRPQILVTQGGSAIFPTMRARPTMPIVFVYSGDPVEARLADSFARPGQNLTGISLLSLDLVGKRMELLKEVLPGLKRVAVLANPEHPGEQSELRVSQDAAKRLGLTLEYFSARTPSQLEEALAGIAKLRVNALVVFPDAVMNGYSERIAAFALSSRIPAISGWSPFVERGNFMSYAPDQPAVYRRVAIYVDKILKGANAADLPIELPTTVELAINLSTAKRLGIVVPQSVLLRADKVIE
jgi:putative ABC transport system substrate-binding protein